MADTQQTLTGHLDSIAGKLEKSGRQESDSVTIGDILDMTGRRAYGRFC